MYNGLALTNADGFLHYHYHHGLNAHLHPDGKCPYGSNDISIINPYTGKEINLGLPYIFNGIEYFSLNLVSKALTAHDGVGVELGLGTFPSFNSPDGMFYACSTGNSSLSEGIGKEFHFTYPSKDNTPFETSEGEIKLFYHNKQAAYDDIACYAYISIEAVRKYMTNDGYFTDLSDDESRVWNFKVRKPSAKIITPGNDDLLYVGGDLAVEAKIENAAHAVLTVGEETNRFTEHKYNLENQPKVTFSKIKLTKDQVGNLPIMVEFHTGGIAIQADLDARANSSGIRIHVAGSGKEEIEIAPWLIGFKGKPTGAGGRSVTYSFTDWEKLKVINPGIDWYSYENQTEPNQFTSPYLTNRQFSVGTYGELTDETDKYWITLGPKVFISNYPDTGELKADEFGPYIGCRVDVVLYNEKDDEFAYIECVFSGNLKAHTFDNGIFQTGYPYPNSDIAKKQPYEDSYVNGSMVEFTGKEPSTNGTMSKYSVVELIVYPK